jgi:hypothetical protein
MFNFKQIAEMKMRGMFNKRRWLLAGSMMLGAIISKAQDGAAGAPR